MPLTDTDIARHVARITEAAPALAPEAARLRRTFVVDRVWGVASRYTGLGVVVDAEFEAAFTTPGQYVTLRFGEFEPRFFVIANGPTRTEAAREWEFLIDRSSDEMGPIYEALTVGSPVTVSLPEGRGFPMDAVTGRDVLLFVTGSGIASVRPALHFWARFPKTAPREVTLYYGESSRFEVAYADELHEWRAQGVRVFQAFGDILSPDAGFQYVQHCFLSDRPSLDDAFVFLSGSSVMMAAVTEMLLRLGLAPDRILTNV